MLIPEGIVTKRRNYREPRRTAHGRLVLFQDLDEHGMAMRRTTRFSMVSSIRDDSFGREHLLSAIYALAETARGETAVSLHQIRSTFTARRSVNVAVNGLVQTQDRGYSKLPSA